MSLLAQFLPRHRVLFLFGAFIQNRMKMWDLFFSPHRNAGRLNSQTPSNCEPFWWHIYEIKMRHHSWHPASISSTSASCSAAKIRTWKRYLYWHQRIDVAQAAVQDRRAGCRGAGRRQGVLSGRQLQEKNPEPRRKREENFKAGNRWRAYMPTPPPPPTPTPSAFPCSAGLLNTA